MVEDRTHDFLRRCQQLAPTPPDKRAQRHTTPVEENIQFNAAASDVSKEIFQVSRRLQQLTQLVRQNNMFNDPAEAINELAALVKGDITDINVQLDNLQEYINSRRSTYASHQAATHSDAIVSAMKSNLMATTRGFKDVLEVRQQNMKVQQNRRSRYGKAAASTLGKPLAFSAPPRPESGDATQGNALPRPHGVTDYRDTESEIAPLIPVMSQEQAVAEQQNYTHARADAISQIESHIVEIGQQFGRLSTLIQEQGELVQRIDDNVDDTVGNINSGQNELIKYYASLSNNRMLALKVSAILLIFIVFFLFFLA